MRRLKILTLTLVILFLGLSVFLIQQTVLAKEVEGEREYKPIDLVLVIDGSGSMDSSDPGRTAISAGRMLTNMMPASDSRIAIISFNTAATVHTGNGSESGALVSLDAFDNVERVREALSAVVYSGDTGIGNALYAAVELLQKESDSSHQGAIILFTDGTNDFGRDAIGLARCEENEALALKQAKTLGYPVYCVGYDYKLSNGGSSMGANGEGLVKLQNIADTTGGKFQVISDIDEMEQLLIEFLADVCDLNYKRITTIPGDGDLHEVEIPVSPSVVELDIRIAGGDENAISEGEIHLYDPNGDEIVLTNSGNVRYDVDAAAASIKIIMPQSGGWKLTVNDIYGKDIHVGMLEHFKMNLKGRLVYPDKNPEGVVYTHDKVGIEARLTYEGEELTDEDLYNAVTSATATFVSHDDETDVTVVNLKRKGTVFSGSFTVPTDSLYDVTIRISWDTVYRECKLLLPASNHPLMLVGEIEDVKLNKNKNVTIDNIFQYVYDEENDPITAEIKNVGSPDVADVSVNGDSIVITGRKWSSTLVTVLFRDKQGNTVESTFMVKVNDPVALALIIGGTVALVLAALGIVYLLYKRTFKIRGMMRVGIIRESRVEDGKVVEEKVVFEDPNRLNTDDGTGLYAYVASTKGIAAQMDAGTSPGSDPFGMSVDPFGTSGAAFGTTSDPFGTTSDPLGSKSDPFGTAAPASDPFASTGGFEEPSAGGDPFVPASSPFGQQEGFDPFGTGDPFGVAGAWDANQDSDEGPSSEELEDARLHTSYTNGLLELGSVAGHAKSTNLFEVLRAFQASYVEHMTPLHRKSLRAEMVQAFVGTRLSALSDIMIEGSPYGRSGIVVRLPKKTSVNMESPRVTKRKVVTKQYGKKPIIFTFSLPSGGSDTVVHVEFEYLPPM